MQTRTPFRVRALAVVLGLLFLIPVIPVAAKGEAITVLAPNGGETLSGGDHVKIRWNATSDEGVVKLYYSTDGGRTYPNNIATVSNGPKHEYNWSVPDNVNTSRARVRIVWLSTGTFPFDVWAEDESDQNFTIEPSVAVRFTRVDARVTNGRYSLVRWDLFDADGRVQGLDLQQRINDNGSWSPWQDLGGTYGNISASEGGIWWQAPHYTEATVQLRIRALSNIVTRAVIASDDSPVINVSSPTVLVKRPNGGETILAGGICSIEWATSPDPEQIISSVGIEYSLDSGASWTGITEGAENTHVYSWNVPAGINSDSVRVKVIAEYPEWIPFASDTSDFDFTVTTDTGLVAVALYKPNPTVPGGLALKGGDVFWINWTVTGPSSEISSYRIHLSTDNGTTFEHILNSTAGSTTKIWNVPHLDTAAAKVRLECVLNNGTVRRSQSNHPFIIFTNMSYNRQAVADAGPDQEVTEGQSVRLYGGRSYDMDREPFNYSWRQADSSGIRVELGGTNTSTAFFVPQILDYAVDLLFELTVDDGHYHDPANATFENVSYVSVQVTPVGPRVDGISPLHAMAGMTITLTGDQLRGAQILVGGAPSGAVATAPTPDSPDPDREFRFTLAETIPHRDCEVVVRNRAGESTAGMILEVFPVPQFCYDWGFSFGNPSKDNLTYPMDQDDQGSYHDTFGDSVYAFAWICFGVPIWVPFYGWVCIGYAYNEPVGPDPIAYAYYTAHYEKVARGGECFGVSATLLQFRNREISTLDFNRSASRPSMLTLSESQRRIDFMQGSVLSMEAQGWIREKLSVTDSRSVEGVSGLGLVLSQIREAVTNGSGGIISMWQGRTGHAVVPYLVEDVNSTTTRIYVCDPNRPWASDPARMEYQLRYLYYPNNWPPYIEINKTGEQWSWSFVMPGGMYWGNTGMIVFMPYSVVNGRRTLLTSMPGIFAGTVGDATCSMEDREGQRIGWEENGSLTSQIPGGSPVLVPMGENYPFTGYQLPAGNYTSIVSGTADGEYSWNQVRDGNSSFSLDGASIHNGTRDTINISYDEGNNLWGRMSLRTTGGLKAYNITQVKKFGNETDRKRARVYKIMNSTLYGDSEGVFNTTPDCNALIFYNNGPHSVTYDVEFQTNVLSEEAWNFGPRPSGLPGVTRKGITIGPYQTQVLRPTNWLNLMNSTIIIEGEGLNRVPGVPQNLKASASKDRVSLSWSAPDNGGSPITAYIVMRGDKADNLSLHAMIGNVTTYVDTEVKAGKTYHYAVLARNSVGGSNATATVSATVPKQAGEGGGPPILLILLLAVIILAAVVAMAALMMRKKGPPNGRQ